MAKHKYIVKCFNVRRRTFGGKVELSVLEESGTTEIETKFKIDPLDVNEARVRRVLQQSVGECDYALITDLKGKNEVFVATSQEKRREAKETLFPRPAQLLSVYLLKRQETMDMEENVVFSRTLIKEEIPIKRKCFIYDGSLTMGKAGESVVAIRLLTDKGIRVMLRNEAGISLPKLVVKGVSKPLATKKSTKKPKKKSSRRKRKKKKRRSSKKKR